MTSTPAVVSPEASRHSTHFITQTLLGPICTHQNCNKTVAEKGALWTVSVFTIRRHWRKNKCYTGPRPPNATHLAKYLNEQLIRMHGRIGRDTESTDTLINKYIPAGFTETFTTGFCGRCGYVNKPSRVKKETSFHPSWNPGARFRGYVGISKSIVAFDSSPKLGARARVFFSREPTKKQPATPTDHGAAAPLSRRSSLYRHPTTTISWPTTFDIEWPAAGGEAATIRPPERPVTEEGSTCINCNCNSLY